MKYPLFIRSTIALVLLVTVISACNTGKVPSIENFSLSSEPLVGKFVWHDLITEEPAAVRQFYSGLFGWEFEETTLPGGKPYTLARLDNSYIGGIVEVQDPGEEVDFSRWLGYLSVANVETAVEVTSLSGGQVLVEPKIIENIGTVAAIQDPQGAVLGLIRSIHGDPDDNTPVLPGHIVWNELLASDNRQAVEFYKALTAYKVETISRRGGEYIVLSEGDVNRAGILHNPFEKAPPTWLTYFAVTDPDAAALKVKSLGGQVLIAPSPDYREGTQALVADPSGAILVLQKWPL